MASTTLSYISNIAPGPDKKYYIIKYNKDIDVYLNILNDHVIRIYSPLSKTGGYSENPVFSDKSHTTSMLVINLNEIATKGFKESTLDGDVITISKGIKISFDKKTGTMSILNKEGKQVLKIKSVSYDKTSCTMQLEQKPNEHFFGCGMQAGEYINEGKKIIIDYEDNNRSPCPFYWSTSGYGILGYNFVKGEYEFSNKSIVKRKHDAVFLNDIIFINADPEAILKDYFEFTGKPMLIPKYAFYEGHAGNFIDMNDKDSVPSAMNMLNEYNKFDMPLGWISSKKPQNIDKLKLFVKYATEKSVAVAILLEKFKPEEFGKAMSEAGVVGLHCHGWKDYRLGYSELIHILHKLDDEFKKKDKRPMILVREGWAGTQRFSNLTTTGVVSGKWNSISFSIPTLIGSGLSGQPMVGTEVDGFLAGKYDPSVSVRQFQWTSFTPTQINMDGGLAGKVKSPFIGAADSETETNIRRAYLKMRSMLLPYNYSIAHISTDGLPMLRAMFLHFLEDEITYSKECKYQFMWGPSLLIAPIYDNKTAKDSKDSKRNGIYLPDPNQIWIDFFTGEKYQGGRFLNEMNYPLWKLPIFVKDGAIIPWMYPSNNPSETENTRFFSIYPNGKTDFDVYEDDGKSYNFKNTTLTEVQVDGPKSNEPGELSITINPSKSEGDKYEGRQEKWKTTVCIMSSEDIEPENLNVSLNGVGIPLAKIYNFIEFSKMENIYTFDRKFTVNSYLEDLVDDEKIICQSFILIKLKEQEVSKSIEIKIKGYINKGTTFGRDEESDTLAPPKNLTVKDSTSETITLTWDAVEDADFYEIARDDVLFSHINKTSTEFQFENLKPGTDYKFTIRTIKEGGFMSKKSDPPLIGKTK